jgi:hypothetical protein
VTSRLFATAPPQVAASQRIEEDEDDERLTDVLSMRDVESDDGVDYEALNQIEDEEER